MKAKVKSCLLSYLPAIAKLLLNTALVLFQQNRFLGKCTKTSFTPGNTIWTWIYYADNYQSGSICCYLYSVCND